jgi:hypothetical protein
MTNLIDRRNFIKISAAVAGGSLVLSSYTGSNGADPIIFDNPEGNIKASPDYEITIKRGRKSWKPFVYYSHNRPVDKVIDNLQGNYVKLSFARLHSNNFVNPATSKDTYAHSWSSFDFSDGPVDVEVKIINAFEGLTLPLKDCRIFPSHLGIACKVIGDNVIKFTLNKPSKIAIVANWQEAIVNLDKTQGKQAFEGYLNPLFLFARAPEVKVPSKKASGTLLIKPGEVYGVEDFAKAKTIYFEPGVHDYSNFNPNDPEHYIILQKGQEVYLAGGAYVYALFGSNIKGPISDMPLVYGRGVFSGDKHMWTGTEWVQTLERNVRLEGITISDPHNHISHSIAPIKDVAVVGAWHGNTDGFTREVGEQDPYEGWHIDDCFVMAADTNLKVGGFGRVRNYTVWQLSNAEPLWLRGTRNITVEGFFVIAYNRWSGGVGVINFRGRGINRNASVKNLIVEAPFIPRILNMSSTFKGEGQAFENIIYENITINSQHILYKSQIGMEVKEPSAYGKLVFRNLIVNGTKVTNENCRDYFELLDGVIPGKELIFE